MRRFSILYLFLFLLFHLACKSTQPTNSNESQSDVLEDPNTNPEILLIVFYINQKDSVAISESYSNVGVYKGSEERSTIAYDRDLKLTFLDQDGSICQEIIVANPLLKKVEYVSDDDSGKMTAEAVDLEEADFFVRLQWNKCLQQIKVERLEDEKWKLLKLFYYTKPSIQ